MKSQDRAFAVVGVAVVGVPAGTLLPSRLANTNNSRDRRCKRSSRDLASVACRRHQQLSGLTLKMRNKPKVINPFFIKQG